MIGDVCMVRDSNALRGEWKICRVKEVYPDQEGKLRNVLVVKPPPGLTTHVDYLKKVM